MTNHISRETLQLLADGELTGDAATAVRLHIKECGLCARVFAAQVRFDRQIRAMPAPRLRREFTQNVLSSLGIPRRVPFLYRAFEHVASLVAVFLVLALTGTVWTLLSLAGDEQGGEQNLPVQDTATTAGKWIGNSVVEFGNWVLDASSRLSGGPAAKLVVMLLLIVTAVAVVDWLVQRKGSADGL